MSATTVLDAEALVGAQRYDAAAGLYAQLDAAGGLDARSLGNFGGVLSHLRHFDAAVGVLTRAVSLDAAAPAPWTNLGAALLEQGRYDDAIAAISHSLRLRPEHAGTLSCMGLALERRGAAAEAVTFFDLAAAQGGTWAQLRVNRAVALLAAGRYPEGFAAFEARHEIQPLPVASTAPLWEGEALEGRTLLVHDEEGFGDAIQFARFLPFAKSSGARIVLAVRRNLAALLGRVAGVDAVVPLDGPIPPHDVRCPIISLARLAGVTPATIPGAAGYLTAEAARLRRAGDTGPQIGLIWAGGRRDWDRACALTDARRSLSLAAFAPLAAARPDATFHSLQIGPAAAELERPPAGMRLVDHAPHIRDFADTASVLAGLDLLISVDTSTPHVAAALGRPTWMLSRFDRCWRWRLEDETTPWYDAMRIFPQPRPGDWTTPIATMAKKLEGAPLCQAGPGPQGPGGV